MAVWRLQEHSPDVYPRKSRDYQLFSVLFDCLNGGVKFDIDSIRDIVDTNQISEKLIPYLQTKLGFFTDLKIPAHKLRTILKAFSTIVRNKGSKIGIQQACEVFLKVEKIDSEIEVTIDNSRYCVIIETTKKIDDYRILTEILRYVLPAGYFIEFRYRAPEGLNTEIRYQDVVRLVSADEIFASGVRLDTEDKTIPDVVNAVSTSVIVKDKNKPSANEENHDSLYDYGNYKKLGREDLWEIEDKE